MIKRLNTLTQASLFALATLSVFAQTGPGPGPAPSGPSSSDKPWKFSLGLGAIYGSRYDGSDDYRFLAIPNLTAEYKDGLFFAGIFDGIGSNFLQGENYKLSASIGFSLGRDEKDDREHLQGLGDIDPGATLEVKGEYSFGPLQLSGKVAKGTQKFGTTAELELGTMFPLAEGLMAMASVGAKFGDAKHLNTYFGITAAQAERSGYSPYEAGAGIESAGASLGLMLQLSDRWEIMTMLNGDKLLGDAADSPIIQKDFSPTAFVITSYKF